MLSQNAKMQLYYKIMEVIDEKAAALAVVNTKYTADC